MVGFRFSHNQSLPGAVHPQPDEARSRVGRWRQPQKGWVSVPPEVAAQAASGSSANGWDDRRPRSPDVEGVECFSKAKRSAQERPLPQHISHTDSYLVRARKRLTAHDAARQQLVTNVEESEALLERLRAVTVAADSVPTTHLQTR